MIQLLFYMNCIGSLFFVLHLLLLPFEKNNIPPEYRIYIYRLNLMFFIIPIPICLYYIRRYFDNVISELPVVPFVYSGTYVIINVNQNISFALPRLNYIYILLFLLWIVIMIWRYKIFSVQNHRLRRFHNSYDLYQKNVMTKNSINVADLVNTAVKELKLKKNPRIFLQDGIPVPQVSGIFHLTLCLPYHWAVSEEVYYMAIKHELAHVRHKDLLFQPIERIAKIISWFNPILYLMCKKMEACEELAADACACEGVSSAARKAYQMALVEISEMLDNIPNMPVKRLGFKRNPKKILLERILTMNNMKLRKHKTIKLAATAVMSAVLFTLSAVPALAYNMPSTMESEELAVDAIDMLDVNVLSSEGNSKLDFLRLTEGELNSLFEDIDFSEHDFVCIDENGDISYVTTEPRIIPCNHNYLAAVASHHVKASNGGCTTTHYNAKKCAKCGHIVVMEEIGHTTYVTCPH